VIGAAATGILNGSETGEAVFQLYTLDQSFEHFHVHLAEQAHCILAFNFPGRVHQTMGELTVSGKQEQTGGIDIKTANADPAAGLRFGQA